MTRVQQSENLKTQSNPFAPLAIVGMECRLPGAANLSEYARLLREGRQGFRAFPQAEFDRDLYFQSQKGVHGKTYTEIGGFVEPLHADSEFLGISASELSRFDPVHVTFADVALRAWQHAGFKRNDSVCTRTGIFVGHSGATKLGGPLNLATHLDESLDLIHEIPEFRALDPQLQSALLRQVAIDLRNSRPRTSREHFLDFHAYNAAALAARLIGLQGPRLVTDAACASSLIALQQASFAIQTGRIDTAIVGGATTNGVDNLILFSHSQACSASGSCPFDEQASGLISSEGYAALVIMPLERAERLGRKVLGVITGIGIASDGRGKSLWAPRQEGQKLAIERAYKQHHVLEIDYLEAHATSTQLGDATELHALHRILQSQPNTGRTLFIGSAKSNLGHTLETAGIAGLIKVLLSLQNEELPASLKVHTLNKNFPWEQSLIQVVRRNQVWSKKSKARRAAVSAFGIGGLNAHIAVQEHQPAVSPKSLEEITTSQEPIAIVGRGVVLPGAENLEEFRHLLERGFSAIGPPPESRYRLLSNAENPVYGLPRNGGYVRNFRFDAQKYRIPPKQVLQANPLQMMLLSAVSQAMQEFDQESWSVDQQRTGVVIGTQFGGDFGSDLQLGLRLPEISRTLSERLDELEIPPEDISEIVQEFRLRVLAARPALLDETGSFTASTLASRIAKTFDLMGGACAIDAEEVSAFAALQFAVDQLRLGHWDLAICGSGERSMDLMKFQELWMKNRLVESGRVEDIPQDGSRILPGEGACVITLQRLSDAIAQNRPILGVIEQIEQQAVPEGPFHSDDPDLVRQIGHIGSAQSLIRIVKESLLAMRNGSASQRIQFRATASDGQQFVTKMSWSPEALSQSESTIPEPVTQKPVTQVSVTAQSTSPIESEFASQIQSQTHTQTLSQTHNQSQQPELTTKSLEIPSVIDSTNASSSLKVRDSHFTSVSHRQPDSEARTYRIGATSQQELIQKLDQILNSSTSSEIPASQFPASQLSASQCLTEKFSCGDSSRLVLLAHHPEELKTRLKSVRKKLVSGRKRGLFETERAILWTLTEQPVRTAWVFPGQGSHYTGTPSALAYSDLFKEALSEIDAEFKNLGIPTLSANLAMSSTQLLDIWWNQAWMLGMTVALTAELQQHVPTPDVVLGHSFGEYSALLTSGVLSLPQVVRMVKKRSDSIVMNVRDRGKLISVRSGPSNLDAVLREHSIPSEITHFNSLNQTVIATDAAQVEEVQKVLNRLNLASVVLPVPVAYHTHRLQDAEEILGLHFQSERFFPARIPVMSATSARYLAEPTDLRQSLVSQMTRPVQYVPAIERLISDGVGIFIEVGPNHVLSRLTQEIAGDQAICMSFDVVGRDHSERVQLVKLAEEIVTRAPISSLRHAQRFTLNESNRNANQATGAAAVGQNSSQQNGVQAEDSAQVEVEIIDLHRVKSVSVSQVEEPQSPAKETRSDRVHPAQSQFVAEPSVSEMLPDQPGHIPSSGDENVLKEMLSFLRTVVMDQTGYPAEIIDDDADLEGELGVDSIKKAQIIGEMAEQYELRLAPAGVRFGDYNTLSQIATLGAQFYQKISTVGDSHVEISSEPHPTVRSGQNPPVTHEEDRSVSVSDSVSLSVQGAGSRSESVGSGITKKAIETFLIDLVVDQTGYSPEIVDLDADLEAELGIDSIKQAQMIGEVQQQFEISFLQADQKSLSHLPNQLTTLRAIVEIVDAKLNQRTDSVPATQPEMLSSKRHTAEVSPQTSSTTAVKKKLTSSSTEKTDGLGSGLIGAGLRGLELDLDVLAASRSLFSVQFETTAREFGSTHRTRIRQILRILLGRGVLSQQQPADLEAGVSDYLRELADSSGVAFKSVLLAHLWSKSDGDHGHPPTLSQTLPQGQSRIASEFEKQAVNSSSIPARSLNLSDHVNVQGPETARFLLRMVPASQREGMPNQFPISGPALVVGKNAIADALVKQFEKTGQQCYQLTGVETLAQLEDKLQQIWSHSATPHLFLTMSHDADSLRTLKNSDWQKRRFHALELPYRLCQLWMSKTIELNQMDGASVVLVTQSGGDLGVSGESLVSPESGLAGLVKAMLIESWMRGYRSTPMKVIDLTSRTTPRQAVSGIWGELSVPNYDLEVAFDGTQRFTVQPIHVPLVQAGEDRPIPTNGHSQIHTGGVWVVTGGARGITAYVSRQLAKRHRLQLQLIGTAPVPDVSAEVREAAKTNRLALRREVMRLANDAGHNGMEAWRNFEKGLEIDETLSQLKAEGIQANYYSCDVSKSDDLKRVLDQIRHTVGPIKGVIHGAGIGQDARFDRKRPDKVDQCFRAKIDGCINLMELTDQDQLDWFVSFGSISGRFGANGHTDYSCANDSLAKLTNLYRRVRPNIRSVTFHWHAWGDLGMATKPETKLALEMIRMEFMPAADGLRHFLNELEFGGSEPEVLITDRSYIRKFYPVDRLISGEKRDLREQQTLPFLGKVVPSSNKNDSQSGTLKYPRLEISLVAKQEPCLSQHLVQSKPTLPFVMALEMLCEAARSRQGGVVHSIRNARALQALKWNSEKPVTLKFNVTEAASPQRNTHSHTPSQAHSPAQAHFQTQLMADLHRSDGRLVIADKLYFEAEIQLGSVPVPVSVPDTVPVPEWESKPDFTKFDSLEWKQIEYLGEDAPIYHGPDFQCLQKIAISDQQAVGFISASSTVQLGGDRPTFGWSLSPAVFDACLYATAVFAGSLSQRSSLPVSFGEIRLGRLPDPGEICHVVIDLKAKTDAGMVFNFELIGMNQDRLMNVTDYQVAWLGS